MIGQHLFYQAHLDYDNKYLILSDRTYEQYQMAREDFKKEQAEKKAKEAEEDKLPEECRKLIAEGQRYVAHIRECNDAIPGEEISRKLDKMEQLVQRIFEEVKIHFCPQSGGGRRSAQDDGILSADDGEVIRLLPRTGCTAGSR